MSRTPVRKPHGRRSDTSLRARLPSGVRAPALNERSDTELGDADTRPVSVWPASTRPADLNSRSFAPTHFDPLLDDKTRGVERAAVALDVCNPMLALRVVLGVQGALAIGVLVTSGSLGEWVAR